MQGIQATDASQEPQQKITRSLGSNFSYWVTAREKLRKKQILVSQLFSYLGPTQHSMYLLTLHEFLDAWTISIIYNDSKRSRARAF